ncbi:hypothetical protein Tco_1230968, partial [Tanacetum coccineum]
HLLCEMSFLQDVFEELEAEVDQNVVDRKHDEIERKNLLMNNQRNKTSLINYLRRNLIQDTSRFLVPSVIDKSTEALGPDENPFGRCLDEYIWVFPKEIGQLADEYEIKIREKVQVLEEIWTKCKRAQSKDKEWWYDYWYEDEEKWN